MFWKNTGSKGIILNQNDQKTVPKFYISWLWCEYSWLEHSWTFKQNNLSPGIKMKGLVACTEWHHLTPTIETKNRWKNMSSWAFLPTEGFPLHEMNALPMFYHYCMKTFMQTVKFLDCVYLNDDELWAVLLWSAFLLSTETGLLSLQREEILSQRFYANICINLGENTIAHWTK